jgi:hypothetical protein
LPSRLNVRAACRRGRRYDDHGGGDAGRVAAPSVWATAANCGGLSASPSLGPDRQPDADALHNPGDLSLPRPFQPMAARHRRRKPLAPDSGGAVGPGRITNLTALKAQRHWWPLAGPLRPSRCLLLGVELGQSVPSGLSASLPRGPHASSLPPIASVGRQYGSRRPAATCPHRGESFDSCSVGLAENPHSGRRLSWNSHTPARSRLRAEADAQCGRHCYFKVIFPPPR